MPKQTRASFNEGVYSTIAPSGVGMKPGMTMPMPFSIQMPTMASTQVTLSRSEADESLIQRGGVFHDRAERRRDEAGNDHAHAFFDPDADDGEHAGDVEPPEAAAHGQHQQHHGGEVESDGRPNPRHERMMAVQAHKEVFGRGHMRSC